jgi:hypothetical protein
MYTYTPQKMYTYTPLGVARMSSWKSVQISMFSYKSATTSPHKKNKVHMHDILLHELASHYLGADRVSKKRPKLEECGLLGEIHGD